MENTKQKDQRFTITTLTSTNHPERLYQVNWLSVKSKQNITRREAKSLANSLLLHLANEHERDVFRHWWYNRMDHASHLQVQEILNNMLFADQSMICSHRLLHHWCCILTFFSIFLCLTMDYAMLKEILI